MPRRKLLTLVVAVVAAAGLGCTVPPGAGRAPVPTFVPFMIRRVEPPRELIRSWHPRRGESDVRPSHQRTSAT